MSQNQKGLQIGPLDNANIVNDGSFSLGSVMPTSGDSNKLERMKLTKLRLLNVQINRIRQWLQYKDNFIANKSLS